MTEYEAKYPKAAACLAADRESLLTFFAFPAEHWIHLRTTNVIESPFATVRLRQRVTKGARLPHEGAADGLQAAGHGAASLAAPQRRTPLAARCVSGVVFVDGGAKERNTAGNRKEAA